MREPRDSGERLTHANRDILDEESVPSRASVLDIRTAIHCGVAYLERNLKISGEFTYLRDIRMDGDAPNANYNLLRHAGATLVLFQLVGSEFDEDGKLLRLAARSWSYLCQFLTYTRQSDERCVSLAERGIAKLGGSALALLALAEALKHFPSRAGIELVNQLAAYLVSQQGADGRFTSKIDLITGVRSDIHSIYYPGQAVLALCSAYQSTQNERYLKRAHRGIRAVITSHRRNPPTADGSADHWSMIALAALHRTSGDPWYVEQLRFLVAPLIADENRVNAWISDPLTTHVSTRLEGLVAALSVEVAIGENQRSAALLRIIQRGLARCYQRQVGHPSSRLRIKSELAYGGYLRSQSDLVIRIDYVQHAVAASFGTLQALRTLGDRIS